MTKAKEVGALNRDEFRRIVGKFATGVTVVTTVEEDGSVHGMTANSFTSVSLEPLLVLACIGHNRNTYGLIKKRGRFAVSILTESQQAIAQYYARDPKDRVGDVAVEFEKLDSDLAVVKGALASIACRVVGAYPGGDHTIFLGQVEQAWASDGKPLLFYESRFLSLG